MFLLSISLFLVLSSLIFSFPGMFIIEKTHLKMSFLEKFFLGTTIGFVSFTLVSYLFLLINLSILAVLIFLPLGLYQLYKTRAVIKPSLTKKTLLTILFFAIGITFQLAVISPSGIFKNGDLIFYSAHGHDGPWHIALMNEIIKGFPLQNPVLAGNNLVNYHFFSDIAPAMFQKHFNFSALDLYFRFFPFIFSLLLGTTAYYLGKHIGKSRAAGLWATFFTYFAGSFGYIATLYMGRGVGGESIFWATQIASSSGNPPQIISNLILLSILYLLFKCGEHHTKTTFFILSLLIGSLAMFKVYAAIVIFMALGTLSIYQIIKHKKFHLASLTLLSGILAAILYLPYSKASASFLIFEPWWYIRTMIVEPSRLNWLDHELRRQHYMSINLPKAWARIIQLELTGFIIFFFGNLGTRFLALFQPKKFLAYPSIMLITIFSLTLPLLFLQKGVASNTSQFLQYFILLMGILAGVSTANIISHIKPRVIKVTFALLVVALSIPTQVALLNEFYSGAPLAKVTQDEQSALNFLKNAQPNSVILTPPYNKYLNLKDSPPHIWDWFDTSYVAAFTGQITYFDDYEQVDIMGYDYEDRKQAKENIFSTEDIDEFTTLINQTEADYLYFPRSVKPIINLGETSLQKSFENELIEIWKI